MKIIFTSLILCMASFAHCQDTKALARQYEQQKADNKFESDRIHTQYTNNLPNEKGGTAAANNGNNGPTVEAWWAGLQAELKSIKNGPLPGTPGGRFTESQRVEFDNVAKQRQIEQHYVGSLVSHYHETLNPLLDQIINVSLPCQTGDCQDGVGGGATASMKYASVYRDGKRNGITTYYVNDPIIKVLNLAYKDDLLDGNSTIKYHDGSYENIIFNRNVLGGEATLVFLRNEAIYFNRNNGKISGVLKHRHSDHSSCSLIYRDDAVFTMLTSNHYDLRYPSKQMYTGGYYMYIKEENMTKVFNDKGDGGFYAGDFKENSDVGHGIGTRAWGSGISYSGTIRDGIATGTGVMYYNNGDIYTGKFKGNSPHGDGTYKCANGDQYVGHFKEGHRNGKGVFTRVDGFSIKGTFKDDNPTNATYYNKMDVAISPDAYSNP